MGNNTGDGSAWKLQPVGKVLEINAPVLIEGLPGIGNVGKIAVDFIVEELKAKKIYDLFSYTMPHSVFVNEQNLVELPSIEMFHANVKGKDFIFLVGDIQPIEEVSSYAFCEAILGLLEQLKGTEIVTTGGIGLQHVPEKPAVYCTGNSKKLIAEYKKLGANDKLYGIVGPIVGVSGLLLGLSQKRKIPAVALLAETFGHPMYVGVLGAREVANVLNKRFGFNADLNGLDKEIQEMQKEIKKSKDLGDIKKQTALKKLGRYEGTEYIG